MLRVILIALAGSIFIQNAKAYQCKYIAPEKMVDVSSYVFTGKVLSKNEDAADISVIKIYKGPPLDKTQIMFPGKILKGYRLLENLELGEVYLFSSYQSVSEDNKLIKKMRRI